MDAKIKKQIIDGLNYQKNIFKCANEEYLEGCGTQCKVLRTKASTLSGREPYCCRECKHYTKTPSTIKAEQILNLIADVHCDIANQLLIEISHHPDITIKDIKEILNKYIANGSMKDVLMDEYKNSISSIIPCMVNDILYLPMETKIVALIVIEIKITEKTIKVVCENRDSNTQMTFLADAIGKTIFTNVNDAEKYRATIASFVHCKECLGARERNDGSYHCLLSNTIRPANYYCGDGKRKE